MAHDEMGLVTERPNKLIQQNYSKLRFVYSHKDNWVPLSYYDDMKRDFPTAAVLLEDTSVEHGFVENLQHSKYMALKCEEMIHLNESNQ